MQDRGGDGAPVKTGIETRRGEKRLHLRVECESPAVEMPKQRLHAEAVAPQKEHFLLGVPNGKGPHAVEARLTRGTPLFVGGEQDFRSASALKPVAERGELFAQLQEIIDFAVIGEL